MKLTMTEVTLFLNYELFWLKNKAITEFAFHRIRRIMQIEVDNTLGDDFTWCRTAVCFSWSIMVKFLTSQNQRGGTVSYFIFGITIKLTDSEIKSHLSYHPVCVSKK